MWLILGIGQSPATATYFLLLLQVFLEAKMGIKCTSGVLSMSFRNIKLNFTFLVLGILICCVISVLF